MASGHGGKREGAGRKKGSTNEANRLLRDAILAAAEKAGGKDGMVGYLQAQAQAQPAAFMALLGKVLPSQVEANVDANVSVKTGARDKLAALLAAGAERSGSEDSAGAINGR